MQRHYLVATRTKCWAHKMSAAWPTTSPCHDWSAEFSASSTRAGIKCRRARHSVDVHALMFPLFYRPPEHRRLFIAVLGSESERDGETIMNITSWQRMGGVAVLFVCHYQATLASIACGLFSARSRVWVAVRVRFPKWPTLLIHLHINKKCLSIPHDGATPLVPAAPFCAVRH